MLRASPSSSAVIAENGDGRVIPGQNVPAPADDIGGLQDKALQHMQQGTFDLFRRDAPPLGLLAAGKR